MKADPIINKRAARHIPVARPSVGWREALAVARVTLSGWISQGRKVAEFETLFAKSHGQEYGSACNSGTTAIQLALAAAGIGPGDRVLCPTFTMVAVPNSILNVGAEPVFYDAAVGNLVGNSSLDEIRSAALAPAGQGARALIVAHCYGEVTQDMAKIRTWCDGFGIILIEDCAEVHYAKGAGLWGDLVCWSFYANKNITTGEGGMVTTSRAEYKQKLDRIRMHAFSPLRHFNHTEKAYGCRMTEMQAAMGIVQHKRAPALMARRQMLRALYEHALGWDVLRGDPFCIPETSIDSAWWVMPIVCDSEEQREGLREWLAQDGIETRTYFVPMHMQEHLKKYARGDYKRAEYLGCCGLYLPLYPAMQTLDVWYVSASVKAWAGREEEF